MLKELSGDQIRIQTNAVQAFEAWREADQSFRHSFKGSLSWRGPGRRYLYRTINKTHKSLGPRTQDNERMMKEYMAQRKRLRDRRQKLGAVVKRLAPINRAYRIGRVPKIAAGILRALDAEGLLGRQLLVIGTHSLYAYEAAAGVHLEDNLIATTDIDLLWDTRRRLKLAVLDSEWDGILGILRRVDPSFARSRATYRAANNDGYLVDLVRPFEKDQGGTNRRGLIDNDLEAAAILGLQWLMNAPRFYHVAMGEDGIPVAIHCVDPRVFALHKRWLADEAVGREPAKKKRDRSQAEAAAEISQLRLGLKFAAKDLSALPLRLVQHAKELADRRRASRPPAK